MNGQGGFSSRAETSRLKRRRERWTARWSFPGDRGAVQFCVLSVAVRQKQTNNLLHVPDRPHRCMSSFQSYSTFSSENLSVSDGEEGNTSDHSHSGPLERLSASQEEHLDELLSHTPDIPIDISTQSDGLSDKECAVRRVKTQISLGKLCSDEHSYEVNVHLRLTCVSAEASFGGGAPSPLDRSVTVTLLQTVLAQLASI